MKRARILAICQACPDNFKVRHCITEDFEIDTHTEINDQDIPECFYDQLEKLAAIVEVRHVEAKKIVMPHLVVVPGNNEGKIIEFLKKNEGQEFNAKTLNKLLDIPYDGLRKLLWRLEKSGKINKPQHGFYSAKFNLTQSQIEKIEHKIKLQFHNINLKIPKIFLPDGFQLPAGMCLNHPTGGGIEAGNIMSIEATCLNEVPMIEAGLRHVEAGLRQVIEIAPNQSMTIRETTENYLVTVEASENPLGVREFFWLSGLLKAIFGGAVEKAVLVKLDVNHDFPETYEPNQRTFGDISGMCLAVYGKGSATRLEGRNMNPNLPIPAFLKKLNILFDTERPATSAPKIEKYVYGYSKPPLSEFRTGLQILVDRGGVEALEDMRRKYREQQAAAEL
jgi:hypothetical protein